MYTLLPKPIHQIYIITTNIRFNYINLKNVLLDNYYTKYIDLESSFNEIVIKDTEETLFMLICKNSPICVDICLEIFKIINNDKLCTKQIFEKTDNKGMTAFMHLCNYSNIYNIKDDPNTDAVVLKNINLILNSKWFKPNYLRVQNINNGKIPLMYACDKNPYVIKYIIDKFIDENMFHQQLKKNNNNNKTPIMSLINNKFNQEIIYIIQHKWFKISDIIDDIAIKKDNNLGKIMAFNPTIIEYIIDKINKEETKILLLNTDYSIITPKLLEYIIESKKILFDDQNMIEIYAEFIKHKNLIKYFKDISSANIIKIISLNVIENISIDIISNIFEITNYDSEIITFMMPYIYPNIIQINNSTNIFNNEKNIDNLIKVSIDKTNKNNKWNLLMLCAKYNPELLSILLNNKLSEIIIIMKEFTDANMNDIMIMDKHKNIIDPKYENFSYLHILTLYHPEHLIKIKQHISNNDLTKIDSNGCRFFEYLYLNTDNNINISQSECNVCMDKKKNIVLIPCGHTICETCVVKIKKCHICQMLIKQIQRFY